MSELIWNRISSYLAATPKHREAWRNIALVAWIFGSCPSILSVVVTHGTTIVFAVLLSINVVFLIINCSFCCVAIQTLKRKRVFYRVCLIFMIINDAVIISSLVKISEISTFQVIGFAGCGLVSVSCLALVVLNSLLMIQGPLDPVEGEREPQSVLERPEDLPQGYVAIRYVSLRRGRLSGGTTFQVQPGQVLSLPEPDEPTSNTGQSGQQPATRGRRAFLFSWRSRSRDREEDARNMPIRIISDGIFNSQRRDSGISLLRRASTTSVEFDNGSIRCTCFFSPNPSTADDEEVPAYSETPTGNISACPIHGINSITPPPYEGSTPYNTLCSVLRLPKYDEVMVPKPITLNADTRLVPENSMATTETASMRANELRSAQLLDRFLSDHTSFETIVETRSERSDSYSSQQVPWVSVASTSSSATDTSSSSTIGIPSTSTIGIPSTSTTTDIPSTSTTKDIPPTSPT